MADVLKTVLLLALPASGKSEVRRYLDNMGEEARVRDFQMGPNVQLDDFPYVHMMRRIDDELAAMNRPRMFFLAPDRSFQDGRDWGTLIHLLNEDYEHLVGRVVEKPASAGLHLMERLDRASKKVGLAARLEGLEASTKKAVAEKIEAESRKMLEDKVAGYAPLEGRTLVVEFARGGKHGSSMPLPAPFGYRYSLSQLSPPLLEGASILYVWVTPEESRRKNAARTDPNDPGSILHHGVPLEVMMNDYGVDDMDWLEQTSEKPGTITVESAGRKFHLPIGRFDNRVDKTSFLRDKKATWTPDQVRAVHEGLKSALEKVSQRR